MSVWLNVLLGLSFLAILGGAAALVGQLSRIPPAERPRLGARGVNRARALDRGLLFPAVEPVIRLLAAWLESVPMRSIRERAKASLTHAGEYVGLSEDELLAVCVICGLSFGAIALAVCRALDVHLSFALVGGALGLLVPWFRVVSVAQARARSVGQALPGAVELAAMCMSAGLDFPGSLRRIVESASDAAEPVIEEFGRVLQELDLGHTRRSAMERLALRVPTEQVREFVNSVVQAEEKGTPLAAVLTIQAQTQRLRRSIAAEETASSAALMLLGPMTLIFLCVIVLLLGPVAVRFMTGGLGPA